jgi:hypothetical protein
MRIAQHLIQARHDKRSFRTTEDRQRQRRRSARAEILLLQASVSSSVREHTSFQEVITG